MGNLTLRSSPTLKKAVLAQKGHTMTKEELRALSRELRQLNAELKKFKGELLAARTREMEQIFCDRVRETTLRMRQIATSINREAN